MSLHKPKFKCLNSYHTVINFYQHMKIHHNSHLKEKQFIFNLYGSWTVLSYTTAVVHQFLAACQKYHMIGKHFETKLYTTIDAMQFLNVRYSSSVLYWAMWNSGLGNTSNLWSTPCKSFYTMFSMSSRHSSCNKTN